MSLYPNRIEVGECDVCGMYPEVGVPLALEVNRCLELCVPCRNDDCVGECAVHKELTPDDS